MKRIAAAGQDHYAIVAIGSDRVKQVDELLVGIPVEDQRAAIRVKRHLEHACLRTGQQGVGKTLPVCVKATHRSAPSAELHRRLLTPVRIHLHLFGRKNAQLLHGGASRRSNMP
jgi:hypothetical protein